MKRDGAVVAIDHPAGQDSQSQVLQVFAIADRLAIGTVRVTDTTSGQGPAGLALLDLHTGGRRFLAYYGNELEAGPDRFTAAVVRPNGAASWIQTTLSTGMPPTEVRKRDSGKSSTMSLDSGSGIDPASLRRTGATISWVDGGTVRMAGLN